MDEQQYKRMLADIIEAVKEDTFTKLGLFEHLNEEQIQMVSKRLLETSIRGYKAGYKRGLSDSRSN